MPYMTATSFSLLSGSEKKDGHSSQEWLAGEGKSYRTTCNTPCKMAGAPVCQEIGGEET